MHAKDKPIPREGDAVWESDALLREVAERTIGYAGADLANLLNEAAILMVSRVIQYGISISSCASLPHLCLQGNTLCHRQAPHVLRASERK